MYSLKNRKILQVRANLSSVFLKSSLLKMLRNWVLKGSLMPHCEQENFQFTDVSGENTIPYSTKSACLNKCWLAKLTTINSKSCESLIYLRSFSVHISVKTIYCEQFSLELCIKQWTELNIKLQSSYLYI